jgi:carbon storage regulator
MLVLRVRRGEFLRIGDDIDVVVDRFKGNAVVIGVEAPPHIKVLRGKLVPDSAVQRDADCGMDGKK